MITNSIIACYNVLKNVKSNFKFIVVNVNFENIIDVNEKMLINALFDIFVKI